MYRWLKMINLHNPHFFDDSLLNMTIFLVPNRYPKQVSHVTMSEPPVPRSGDSRGVTTVFFWGVLLKWGSPDVI